MVSPRSPRKKPFSTYVEEASPDSDLRSIAGMLKGLTHFGKRNLSLRHLKVLVGVEAALLIKRDQQFPTAEDVSDIIDLPVSAFRNELHELVTLRYVHEIVPKYGPLDMTYKMGSTGGTLMRQILSKGTNIGKHRKKATKAKRTGEGSARDSESTDHSQGEP